jgi:hypothetical protein
VSISDGAWIAAGGNDLDGRPGLFKVVVVENRLEKIVEGQALNPVWSPAGDLIVYAGPQDLSTWWYRAVLRPYAAKRASANSRAVRLTSTWGRHLGQSSESTGDGKEGV